MTPPTGLMEEASGLETAAEESRQAGRCSAKKGDEGSLREEKGFVITQKGVVRYLLWISETDTCCR